MTVSPPSGRGVLTGAFEILDVLARIPDGAGLSRVARESGLPKATVHRLLEQLVALGVVDRRERRYVVGEGIARIGSAWRPAVTDGR